MSDDIKHLDTVLRHIERVQKDTVILGERLIEKGEKELALRLIQNGQIHDNSKLSGIEWLYLRDEYKESKPDLFLAALENHTKNNLHHPEAWNSVCEMPRVYVAEFCCDITARANEFGTDVREWIKDKATKKFKFTTSSKIYKEIKEFLDILLEKPFK